MERIGSLKEVWRERLGRLYPIELLRKREGGCEDKVKDKK